MCSLTRLEWYRNPGNGSAQWEAIPIDTIPNIVFPDRTEVVDLDGDGRLDVIVSEENGETSGAETYWWAQPEDSGGEWIRHLITSQGTTNSMDVADINLDGKPDVILAEHRGDKKLAIWNNVGNGLIEQVLSTGLKSHLGARMVDIDADSDLDIVSIAWDDYPFIHLWRNDALKSSEIPKSGKESVHCTSNNK